MSSHQPPSTDTAADDLEPTGQASASVWDIRAVLPQDSAVDSSIRRLRAKLRSWARLKLRSSERHNNTAQALPGLDKQRLSDLHMTHESKGMCTLSHDLYTLRFKLSSQPFVGRFAHVDPLGTQIAPPEAVHCESTLVLTGMKGCRWRPRDELEQLKAWADAHLAKALFQSPALQRTSPVIVPHQSIHSEDCAVASFIYAARFDGPLQAAKPLNCCNSQPQPSPNASPTQPPISTLSNLPQEIDIIDDLTELIEYDEEYSEPKEWRMFHALRLRVPSQSTEAHAGGPRHAESSSTGQSQ